VTNPESTDVALAAFLRVMGIRHIRVKTIRRATGFIDPVFTFVPTDEFLRLRQLFYGNKAVDVSPFELFQAHRFLTRQIRELKKAASKQGEHESTSTENV